MKAPWLLRKIIQWKFRLISLEKGSEEIRSCMQGYLDLLDGLTDEQVAQQVRVEKMLGVDEDMREWSLLEIIEHNTIVNHALKARVSSLLKGESLAEYENFDVKKDVMPGLGETFERKDVNQFTESAEAYLEFIAGFDSLKTEETAEHPVFGTFDAHQFHIMFGFHLGLHLKQAKAVVELVKRDGEKIS